ncbi:MAG: hypothetical protein ABJB69_02185 [Spartobacteria bacterium]
MRQTESNVPILAILCLSALAFRVAGAFVLPNAEEDGYSYVETIVQWSGQLAHGEFRTTDLFGFWLPLFQLAVAIPNVLNGNALLTAQIVSSLCGAASCVLVFVITRELTRNTILACVAFILVLGNPLDVLYSAAAMTDVPFGCLLLASVWFALRQRWIAAAVIGAIAEGVRLEAWTLVLVLPLLQLVSERKIPLVTLSILLLPPLLWLGISYAATGDAFAYFAKRELYQARYLDFYPSRHGFVLSDIRQDFDYLLLGANPVVALAIVVAGGLSILHFIRRSQNDYARAAVIVTYAAGVFALLVAGYVTKRQPVILPRYGLIFFVLGVPLFMWLLQTLITSSKRQIFARIAATIAIALCLWPMNSQLSILPKVAADFRAHREIATTLVTSLVSDARCFADQPSIRVLSGLSPTRFVRSQTTPATARKDRDSFDNYLREQHVAYLVLTRVEDSLPVQLYPSLGFNAGADTGNFEFVRVAASSFGPDVWLYRLRDF